MRLMPSAPGFLSARAMRRLNVALAIWAVFWIGIAAYTAYEVAALRTLGRGGRWPRRSPEYDLEDVSDPAVEPLQREIHGRQT